MFSFVQLSINLVPLKNRKKNVWASCVIVNSLWKAAPVLRGKDFLPDSCGAPSQTLCSCSLSEGGVHDFFSPAHTLCLACRTDFDGSFDMFTLNVLSTKQDKGIVRAIQRLFF